MSILIIFMALILWGIVHSLLASHFVKDILVGIFGPGPARLYRLGYNLLAALSFLPILYLQRTLPDQGLYAVPAPWKFLMVGGQLLAGALLVLTLLQTDILYFVGLRQLVEDRERGSLVTRGLYRLVRHPLYTFSLVFLWLTPSMTQNTLALYLGATIYIVIGANFEERRLLRDFGVAYADYKQVTPMLIPGFLRRQK